MNLKHGDVGHAELAYTGVYEPEETELIARIAREKGGLLVDVGANFGYYTLLWCGQNPNNRSIAFEASPLVLPHLKENIRRNNLQDRVQIFECAASRESGVVHFDAGPADQTGWGGIAGDSISSTTLEVPAKRLDDVLSGEPITLLKIDCEGAAGLLESKAIQHMCFEENTLRVEKLGIQPNATERLVREKGYHCEPLNKRPPFCEFHAWA